MPTTSLVDLPQETLVAILRELRQFQAILNVRLTCRNLYTASLDRIIWYNATSELLGSPLPTIAAVMGHDSLQEVRRRALNAYVVRKTWCRNDIVPRQVRAFPWHSRLQDVQFVPGGNWIVLLMRDGTIALQAVNAEQPAVIAPRALNISSYATSSISFSPDRGHQIMFQCSNRVYVYQIVIWPRPALRLLDIVNKSHLRGVLALCNSTIGDNTIAIDCYHDGGDLLYIKHINGRRGEELQHIGLTHNKDYSTVHILSHERVLLCNPRGACILAVPPLSRSMSSALEIVPADAIWTCSFDIVCAGSLSSHPVLWSSSSGSHVGPLMFVGPACRNSCSPTRWLHRDMRWSFSPNPDLDLCTGPSACPVFMETVWTNH